MDLSLFLSVLKPLSLQWKILKVQIMSMCRKFKKCQTSYLSLLAGMNIVLQWIPSQVGIQIYVNECADKLANQGRQNANNKTREKFISAKEIIQQKRIMKMMQNFVSVSTGKKMTNAERSSNKSKGTKIVCCKFPKHQWTLSFEQSFASYWCEKHSTMHCLRLDITINSKIAIIYWFVKLLWIEKHQESWICLKKCAFQNRIDYWQMRELNQN